MRASKGAGPVATHPLPEARLGSVVRPESGSAALLSAAGTEIYRIAFDAANIGLVLLELDGRVREANHRAGELFGYTREYLLSKKIFDLADSCDLSLYAHCIEELMDGRNQRSVCERRFLHKNGKVLFLDVSMGLARGEGGEPLFVVLSLRDVTERRRLEQLLEEQASFDPLTRALNRMRTEEQGRTEVMRADRYGGRFSVVMVDLDHFKRVNDLHGHAVGDHVLRGFVDLARGMLRGTDVLGRWGGEEFLLLLPNTGPTGAKRLSERLRKLLEKHEFHGNIRITASLGVAGSREGESLASIVDRADAAMYRAKQQGRNRVEIDEQDLRTDADTRLPLPRFLAIHWKRSYASGQAQIDAEHKELMRLGNLLLNASSAEAPMEEIEHLVGTLLSEVTSHFEHEESILRRAEYAALEAHRACHQKLLAQAGELVGRFRAREATVGDLLGFVLHDVVAMHMLREDAEYFPCFHQKRGAAKRTPQAQGRRTVRRSAA